jgi:heme a synthase
VSPAARGSDQSMLHSWVRAAILIGVVQISLGGMIGARFGATVCNTLPGCPGGGNDVSLALFNPFIATTTGAFDKGAIEALHLLHRTTAIILALVAMRIALFAPRLHGLQCRIAYAIAALVMVQVVGGAWFVVQPTLWLALAHNVGAALLLASLTCLGGLIASPPARASSQQ